MTDFKAKIHQISFRLWLRPRPRCGSLQRSPRPPSWIWGPLRGRGEAGLGKRRERGGRGVERREREGPKVLLNQGPSEPCYATDDSIARRALQWTSIRPEEEGDQKQYTGTWRRDLESEMRTTGFK